MRSSLAHGNKDRTGPEAGGSAGAQADALQHDGGKPLLLAGIEEEFNNISTCAGFPYAQHAKRKNPALIGRLPIL
jgi:hypothetical protein